MPRRPRIHLPGFPLHVVQRGYKRDACFFAEEDYLAYREWLGEARQATACALHGYVQMRKHVHGLLSAPESEAVPRLMISLGRRYVQYINKSYRRTGTLWDSRYQSSLVQADSIYSFVSAISNSIPCAQRWSMTRRTIAGVVIGRTDWGRRTHC
jgi:putative transposase